MEIIRDSCNRMIAKVIPTDDHGSMEIRDPINHRLGYYDARRNMTFDAIGHRIGEGNLLALLIASDL